MQGTLDQAVNKHETQMGLLEVRLENLKAKVTSGIEQLDGQLKGPDEKVLDLLAKAAHTK